MPLPSPSTSNSRLGYNHRYTPYPVRSNSRSNQSHSSPSSTPEPSTSSVLPPRPNAPVPFLDTPSSVEQHTNHPSPSLYQQDSLEIQLIRELNNETAEKSLAPQSLPKVLDQTSSGLQSPNSTAASAPSPKTITLHYPVAPTPPPMPYIVVPVPQRPKVGMGSPQPSTSGTRNQHRPIIPQCHPPPPATTSRGLGNVVSEKSFSVSLTDKLEENYLRCRAAVMCQDGTLITPFMFLKKLCDRMKLNIKTEKFWYSISKNETRFRTELYVGGCCGVAHGLTVGFTKQLAAAQVLEQMKFHCPNFKETQYALYPGGTYTKITDKLLQLCNQYDFGRVGMVHKYQWHGVHNKTKSTRWQSCCFVKKMVTTVESDHKQYGGYLAQKNMYLHLAKPSKAAALKLRDYYAVGIDCPPLNNIPGVERINRPSIIKQRWMDKWQVPSHLTDPSVHDPKINSLYMQGPTWQNFKAALQKALDWIQEPDPKKKEEEGMRTDTGENNTENVGAVGNEVNVAVLEITDDEDYDEDDEEVARIFLGAGVDIDQQLQAK